jgi:phospholipid-binding lipoprotein MlaA
VLGPSDPRDAVGMGVDGFMDPFGYITAANTNVEAELSYGKFVLDGIDKRAAVIDELDAIQRSALDVYAQIRSLWRQNRAKELYHGTPPAPGIEDDLYKDPEKQ